MTRPEPEPVVRVTKEKVYALEDLDLTPDATEDEIRKAAAAAFEFDIIGLDIKMEESK